MISMMASKDVQRSHPKPEQFSFQAQSRFFIRTMSGLGRPPHQFRDVTVKKVHASNSR
jgi:hypothetical protein